MLEQAREDNTWDTLAYWIWLKASYQKPVYYNYTYRSIGRILKISKSCAAKHIKIMLDYDWVYIENGHLFLRPFHDLHPKEVTKIKIFERKQDQISSLKAKEITNNLDRQSRKISKKRDTIQSANSKNKPVSKKQYKEIRKVGGLKKYEISLNDRTTLSNKKISIIFGCCKRTASSLQVRMNKCGLIKSEACYEKINVDYNFLPINCFLYNNKYYVKRLANTITPLH